MEIVENREYARGRKFIHRAATRDARSTTSLKQRSVIVAIQSLDGWRFRDFAGSSHFRLNKVVKVPVGLTLKIVPLPPLLGAAL